MTDNFGENYDDSRGITNPVYDDGGVYDGESETPPPPPFDLESQKADVSDEVGTHEEAPPVFDATETPNDTIAAEGAVGENTEDPEMQKTKGEDDEDYDDDDDEDDCCDLNKRCLIIMFVSVGLFVILIIALFVVLSITLRRAEGAISN